MVAPDVSIETAPGIERLATLQYGDEPRSWPPCQPIIGRWVALLCARGSCARPGWP